MNNPKFEYLYIIEDMIKDLINQSINRKGVSSYDKDFLINLRNTIKALFLFEHCSRLDNKIQPVEEK